MKGKRTCKERILAFMLTFAMVVGMVMEPVQLQAAAVEGEPVQEEIVTEPSVPEEEQTVEENSGISLFSADGSGTEMTDPSAGDGNGDGTGTGEGGETSEPGDEKETYTVTVTPASYGPYYQGKQVSFQANVEGSISGSIADPTIVWSCTENAGSTIDQNGILTIGENASGEITVTAEFEGTAGNSTIQITPALTYDISGKVIVNNIGVEGATVSYGEGKDPVVTDKDGNYTISDLRAGEHTLIVSKAGFDQATKPITVAEGDPDVVQSVDTMEMKLKGFTISADTNEMSVNQSLKFSHSSELLPEDIVSIEWTTDNQACLTIDTEGVAVGQLAGNANVTAILHTKYGDLISSNQIVVTVKERTTNLILTVDPENPSEGQRIKKIVLTAKVTDDEGNPLNEGEVQFKVKRAADSDLGEPGSEDTYTVGVSDGVATYTLKRNKIDFYGAYTFTAKYSGVQDKYLESEEAAKNYNYKTDPMQFFDESGKDIASTVESPFQVVYGNSVSIYLKNEENVEYTAQLRPGSDRINISQQTVSDKEGYTEFKINTLSASEEKEPACTITFIKTDHSVNESLYTNFYVKVNQRQIEINTEEASVKYSKIYDKDLVVTNNKSTEDEITLDEMPILQSEEGGIVNQDEVWVNLEVIPEKFQGSIADGLENVTGAEGTESSITFNEIQLSLDGDKAGNYVLANKEITVPAVIIINPRPVKIEISDAEREFGHGINNGINNEPSYIFTDESWMDINKAGGNPVEGLLESDIFEIPDYVSFMIEQNLSNGNLTKPGTYNSVLSVDTDKLILNYELLKNYEITVSPGNLEIVPEKISNPEDYLNLNSYEHPEDRTMYIAEADGEKLVWVRAEDGTLKLYANSGRLYNDVILLEVNGESVNGEDGVSLTTEGYTFNKGLESGMQDVKLTLKMRRNPGEGEDANNIADSKPFPYNIKLDGNIPEVSIGNVQGSATIIDKLQSAVTFGNFGKETYYVNVSVSDDMSGLKQWQYAVLPLDRDIENGEDLKTYIQTLIDEKKEDGELPWSEPITEKTYDVPVVREKPGQEDFVANNYVVLVKPYDNVENSDMYTSMGIILDNNDPLVEIGLADGQTQKEIYNDSVNLTATVRDTNQPEGDAISGIQKVSYRIAIGEQNLEKTEEIVLFEKDENKTYSLQELKNELKTLPITVNKENFNSNDVWVKVTAWDNSGNEYPAILRLKIDITKPTVQVKYETEASEDYAPYYNKERIATITVNERNVKTDNINELYFYLKREHDSEAIRYNLSALDALDGVTAEVIKDTQDGKENWELLDDRTIEIRVCFEGDDKYNFDVNCTDGAGWKNEENNQSYFVIDKTAPVMDVSYYTTDATIGVPLSEENRVYSGKEINTKVVIKEHNFALDGENVNVDVEVQGTKVGEGETIPDYNSQEKINNGEVWFAQNVDQYASIYTFSADANYTHSITYTDLAGNSVTYGPGYFTVDKTNPTGSVSINGFGFWETLLHNITFGLFNPSSVDVEMTAADHTSPLNPIQYFRTPNAMTRDQLEAYDWSNANAASWENPGYAAFTVNPDEQFVVYTRVTDYAGNYEYFSSDGMIVDSTKPAPVVTITNLSQSQNGIFNEDVTLQIDVEDPYAGDTYSGLERVWYTVSASGNVNTSETIELLNNSSSRVQSNQTFSQVITVPANVYNSNDVKVQAFAVDFSGNQGESEVTEMKIDVTNPTISVSWDLNNPLNGSYYKDTRTATVTVTDRNFDPNNVRFSITNTDGTEANIGGWSSSSDIGVSDNATSTCQVAFPADGDYTFTLGCTDLAGNSTEYGQTDEFTIDKTVPEISVSYNNNSARNGNYYNEARTATVTVREHNFNAADVKAAITASLEGRGISAPSISGFSGSGDVHTATVTYGTDGDYTFDVEYTDMAGNAAADYTPDDFTVDLTEPEIEITDVADKSANNDVVSPSVKATDVNYDSRNVTITITGAKNGKVNIGNVVSAIQNGQTVKFNDFAREDKMDDLYTLTAKAIDMAGNEKEESIIFSVNRYGSVYVLDTDTAEWLDVFTPDENGEDKTYEYTYINQEREIGVTEYNVDTIEQTQITVNRDGNIENLKEKTDYEVTSSGTEAQWKANHYVLKADNFATEGNYSVIFSTQDKAGNTMNNTSVKQNKNLPIEFAVDKTAPTVVVSGVEDGGSYRSAEQTMTVDAKDNLALNEVVVSVDGTDTIYETDILAESNGVIDMPIASANNFQQIEVTASDKAGNIQKMVSNGNEQKESLSVLVTPNIMVQYYMNKPLFYGSIIGIVAVAGLIIFLVVWKRRKNEGKR